MTVHYSGRPPQDEWHRRVLALDNGLLPRHEGGSRNKSHTTQAPRCRPQPSSSGLRRYALLMVAGGAGITALVAMLE